MKDGRDRRDSQDPSVSTEQDMLRSHAFAEVQAHNISPSQFELDEELEKADTEPPAPPSEPPTRATIPRYLNGLGRRARASRETELPPPDLEMGRAALEERMRNVLARHDLLALRLDLYEAKTNRRLHRGDKRMGKLEEQLDQLSLDTKDGFAHVADLFAKANDAHIQAREKQQEKIDRANAALAEKIDASTFGPWAKRVLVLAALAIAVGCSVFAYDIHASTEFQRQHVE